MSETAPDGTPIEVKSNFGKPTRAQELAQALAEARKAKKGRKAPASPPAQTTDSKPTPLPETTDSTEFTEHPLVEPTPDPKSAAPSESKPAKGKAPQSVHSAESVVSPPPKPAPEHHELEESVVSEAPKPRRSMQVRFTGMKPMHVVEAALFAAGKPITLEDIAEQTGLPPDKVKEGVKELQTAYQDRDTVLEVGKAGTKWAMQVRSQAAEPAARFAPMEIAPKLLKTLALIAFHQPMKQSQLVEMMGSKVYDHIPELVERGLVRAREDGPTKILGTTALFPEYFGLDASDPDEIRALMGRLVGIEAAPKPKEPAAEAVYEEPQAQAQSPEGPSGPAQVPAPETPLEETIEEAPPEA